MEYESRKASSDVLKPRNIYIYIYIFNLERPGRDADPSPPSSAVDHERVET
jgi:hypothetical protein